MQAFQQLIAVQEHSFIRQTGNSMIYNETVQPFGSLDYGNIFNTLKTAIMATKRNFQVINVQLPLYLSTTL
jgi:hypothetical protein